MPTPVHPPRSPAGRTAALTTLLGLAVALAATAWCYRAIAQSFFFADDFLHLFQLANRPGVDFLFRTHAGHGYVVRNLVFWATYAAFGPNSTAFYTSALVGHLVAVALLYAVALRATGSAAVACLGAVLWGTSPANAGTLGWYSVFGQVLATILILTALWLLVDARDDVRALSLRRLVVCGVLLVLSTSCFGVGLPVVAASPLVVWLLAPPSGLSRRHWLVALAFPLVAAVLYLTQMSATGTVGDTPDPGGTRLTFAHLPFAAGMFANLLGWGIASLLRGPWSATIPWPTTVSLAIVASGVLVIAAGLVGGDRRARRLVMALGLVVVLAYAAIAAARAPLYSLFGWSPTASGETLRYHYLTQAALVLALGVSLETLLRPLPERLAGILVVAMLALVLRAESRRLLPLKLRGKDRLAVEMVVDTARKAALAAPPGATVRLRNRIFPNVSPFISSLPEAFPGTAAIFVVFVPDNDIEGRHVVFEAQNPRVLAARALGGRVAELIVEPAGGYPALPYGKPQPAQ